MDTVVNTMAFSGYPDGRGALAEIASGDIIRDMGKLFAESRLAYEEREVGGLGSVHLYVAQKQ